MHGRSSRRIALVCRRFSLSPPPGAPAPHPRCCPAVPSWQNFEVQLRFFRRKAASSGFSYTLASCQSCPPSCKQAAKPPAERRWHWSASRLLPPDSPAAAADPLTFRPHQGHRQEARIRAVSCVLTPQSSDGVGFFKAGSSLRQVF